MLIEERMKHPVLTIAPTVPVQDALLKMKKEKVTRYPVVDRNGNMVGIVSDTDLMNARPSEATSLSVWEINSLVSKITVERVMTKKVITVDANATIEEAARIMADAQIGGMPVMRNGKMVGMITQTDLFHVFLEVLGARVPGVRITVLVLDRPGTIYSLAGKITELGGDIKGLGAIDGDYTGSSFLTFKIVGVPMDKLREGLEPMVEKVIDIREEKGTLN